MRAFSTIITRVLAAIMLVATVSACTAPGAVNQHAIYSNMGQIDVPTMTIMDY